MKVGRFSSLFGSVGRSAGKHQATYQNDTIRCENYILRQASFTPSHLRAEEMACLICDPDPGVRPVLAAGHGSPAGSLRSRVRPGVQRSQRVAGID